LNSQELIRDALFLLTFSLQPAKFYLNVNFNLVLHCLYMYSDKTNMKDEKFDITDAYKKLREILFD